MKSFLQELIIFLLDQKISFEIVLSLNTFGADVSAMAERFKAPVNSRKIQVCSGSNVNINLKLAQPLSLKSVHANVIFLKYVFSGDSHFPLTLRKRDAAYDLLKYSIRPKGCRSLTQCHSLLSPWWIGCEGHLLSFLFCNLKCIS